MFVTAVNAFFGGFSTRTPAGGVLAELSDEVMMIILCFAAGHHKLVVVHSYIIVRAPHLVDCIFERVP